MSQVAQLSETLTGYIRTTKQLRLVANILETLTANPAFKDQTRKIASDEFLTPTQKTQEIKSILSSVDSPQLQKFFDEQLTAETMWLFAPSKFDYFDSFVKTFQLMADNLQIIYLVTSVPISDDRLQEISQQFHKLLDKPAIMSHQVNKEIIGGVQIRVGNLVFDYSIKAKLKHFKKQWIKSLTQTSDLLGLEDQFLEQGNPTLQS